MVGVIASLALFFLRHVLFPDGLGAGLWMALDRPALLLAVAATLALVVGKQGVVRVIVLSGLAGWALQALGWAG